MGSEVRPSWIALDWGTTHLRAYAMDGQGAVLARAAGPGMGALAAAQDDFEDALLAVIDGWLGAEPTPIIACGMVGSRQGWHEAGYLPVPQDLSALGDSLARVPARDRRLSVWIVPGLSQSNPYDVMRGEETQLAGYVADRHAKHNMGSGSTLMSPNPWICLPGTHAKWARLEASKVEHFSTAMTGEVFDLLVEHSILRHSVSQAPMNSEAFDDAVKASFHNPASLTQILFSVRAEGLLAGEDGARARGRVSGSLIGAELAALDLPAGQVVPLIGSPALCKAYAQGLACIGRGAEVLDGEAMVLKGLTHVYAQLHDHQEVTQ